MSRLPAQDSAGARHLLGHAPRHHHPLLHHRAQRRRHLSAGSIPISVFPDTNFPRVVIGIDNGVMPVDQMQVTITKPIEDAVNSVPGLEDRTLQHQPRLCRGQPLLRLERGHVPHPATGRRRPLQGARRRSPPPQSSPPTASPSPPFPSSATASPPIRFPSRGSGRWPPTISSPRSTGSMASATSWSRATRCPTSKSSPNPTSWSPPE